VALDIALQTLEALSYLHRKGIVHRDISPENIMLTEDTDGSVLVKLIDLGVAKAAGGDPMTQTATGIFVGKLQYGSPEQLGMIKRGERIDGRSDVYSLGCVLYLMLTGQPPFLSDSPQGYISQHLIRGPKGFAETDPEGRVPEEIRDIVVRALQKNRNDRWANADEMIAALRQQLDALKLKRDMDPEFARTTRGEVQAVLAQVHEKVLARHPGEVVPKEMYEATIHVEAPSTGAQRLATAAPIGTPAPSLRIATAPAPAPPPVSPAPAAPAASAPPPDLRAPASARTSMRGPGSLFVALGAAAVLVVAVVAVTKLRGHGEGGPKGALLLTATPWGRVISVVDEATRKAVDAPIPLDTPARLALAPGKYELTIKGGTGDGAEVAVTAEVRAGEETPVNVRVPGFDLEKAVRTYVP
jgi:serine/threonine-protein kinase